MAKENNPKTTDKSADKTTDKSTDSKSTEKTTDKSADSKSTEKSSSDKRERILQAALKVFSHKSFHQVKVEEIASQAGVGKGTVYEYFSSKEELLQNALKVSSERHMDIFDRCLESPRPFWERVKMIIELHINFLKDHEEMARFVMESHSRPLGELKGWMLKKRSQRLEKVKAILQRGIDEGEIRDLEVETASRLFLGLTFSVFAGFMFFDKMLPQEEMVDTILDILRRGMGTEVGEIAEVTEDTEVAEDTEFTEDTEGIEG